MIKLSIVIVSLAKRHALLTRLISQLTSQPRFHECELVVIIDDGEGKIGLKRNQAVAAARGSFIVHIDDDDEVDADYLELILTEIDTWPNTDAILVRGRCTSPGFHDVEFDYRLGMGRDEARWVGSTLWRTPGHLCPVRRSIAKNVSFPVVKRGEDLLWAGEIRDMISTVSRAGNKPLYLYRLAPEKAKAIPQMVYGESYRETVIIGTPAESVSLSAHEPIFAPQYAERSGPGSKPDFARPYIDFLRRFVFDNKIQSLIDLGCGDMEVMATAMNSSSMAGVRDAIFVDCIAERIRKNREALPYIQFAHADLRTFTFDAELIICKDVLQHWSTPEVQAWLTRLLRHRDRFRFALITNCNYGYSVNTEIETGGWRALDLTKLISTGEIVFQWGDDVGGHKDVVLIKGLG